MLANSGQAILAAPSQDHFGHIGYPQFMGDEPNKIRMFRKERGLTLQQLGELTMNPKTGKPTDLATIQKLEVGRRGLDSNWRDAVAAALGVKPEALTGATVPARQMRWVPLAGKIPQGNWRLAIEDPVDLIPTTKGGPNTFALIPDGDSMNLIVSPGAVIFCDPDDKEMVDGKCYAMMNGDGEVTFKQYREKPPRLVPCSSNDQHKEMLIGDEPLIRIGRIVGEQRDL